MPLDSAACADKLAQAMVKVAGGTFAADFAKAYNDYAKGGVILGAVNTGGDESLLKTALESITASPAAVDTLAAAFSAYWATVALVGDGSHGGAPISVVNDAAAKTALFKAAIVGSMGVTEAKPYYLNFITQLESVVTGIVWTVTEAMPPVPTPTPFPEVIT